MNRNVITVKRAGRLIHWMAGESLHAVGGAGSGDSGGR